MKVKCDHRSKFSNLSNSNPVEALIFFRLLLSNCLNWKIYCDDHTSLSYKSTSVLSRMPFSDWLRYSRSIKQLDYEFEISIVSIVDEGAARVNYRAIEIETE